MNAATTSPPRSVVVVLATGGTIAGLQGDARDGTYTSAQLSIERLMASSGGASIHDSAFGPVDIELEQVAQIDSKDMTHALWQRLGERCEHHLLRHHVRGLVITHGTDTMEETATFLQRVLGDATKPVVLTGAMRPADAIDADGPMNLKAALHLAASTRIQGTLVAMHRVAYPAAAARKWHPWRLEAFASEPTTTVDDSLHRDGDAMVARWVDERWRWVGPESARCNDADTTSAQPARQRPAPSPLPPSVPSWRRPVHTWPCVIVLHAHAGMDEAWLLQAIDRRVDGVIVETTGNGTMSTALQQALLQAKNRHGDTVTVRRITRCPQGAIEEPASVLTDLPLKAELASDISAAKARVTLMLDLMESQPTQKPNRESQS